MTSMNYRDAVDRDEIRKALSTGANGISDPPESLIDLVAYYETVGLLSRSEAVGRAKEEWKASGSPGAPPPTFIDIVEKLAEAQRQAEAVGPEAVVDPVQVLDTDELAMWNRAITGDEIGDLTATQWFDLLWREFGFLWSESGGWNVWQGITPDPLWLKRRLPLLARGIDQFAPWDTNLSRRPELAFVPADSMSRAELEALENANLIRSPAEMARERPDLLDGYRLPPELWVVAEREDGRRVRPKTSSALNEARRLEVIDWLGDGAIPAQRPAWLPDDYDVEDAVRDAVWNSSIDRTQFFRPEGATAVASAIVKSEQDAVAGQDGYTPKIDSEGNPVYKTSPTGDLLPVYIAEDGTEHVAIGKNVDGSLMFVPAMSLEGEVTRRPWLIQQVWSTHDPMLTAENYPTAEPVGGFSEAQMRDMPMYIVPVQQRQRLVQQAAQALDRLKRGRSGARIAGISQEGIERYRSYAGRDADDPSQFAAQYRAGDAARVLVAMDPSVLAMYQNLFVDAGLMTRAALTGRGVAGPGEVQALSNLMTMADQYGQDWEPMLYSVVNNARALQYEDDRETRGLGAESGRVPFVAPTYIAPDYATIKMAVRGTVADLLGRMPEDYELAMLADSMRSDYDREHAATVAAARAQYDATTRAIESGAAQSAGTVQGVDPLSRLQDSLIEKYAGEIENIETREQTGNNMSMLMRSLAGMTGMVQGG